MSENRQQLQEFLSSLYVTFESVDEPVCERYVPLMKQLRKKDRPVLSIDAWIAAQALAEGADLLTLDSRFQSIEELSVLDL